MLFKKFVKDPVHGNIEFNNDEKWAWELLNTTEFKRLLSVSQLGECYNVFHSAKHTRFSHSIGVFYLAKKFLDALNIRDINQRNIVLAAALLHDIGHGPRSHSFELYTGLKHEQMTVALINNKESKIYQILNEYHIDINQVIQIIEKKHKYKWMIQIVSSEIDADRLDYLLRDSYHTGVSYGKSVDYSFLFKKIHLIDNEIVFDKKVVNLIETILFARYQMFKQLYTNHHVLCYEAIMIKIFKRFKKLSKNNYPFKNIYNLYHLFNAFTKDTKWDVYNFIALDEYTYNMFLKSLYEEDDEELKILLKNYFGKNNFNLEETNENKGIDYQLKNKNFFDIDKTINIWDGEKITSIQEHSYLLKTPPKENNLINFILILK